MKDRKTKDQDDLKEKLIAFFKANPNPDDDKVHAFAEQNGINPHELEEEIYKLVTEHVGMVNDKKMKDNLPSAKDKALKALDSLKRRMKDAFGSNIEEQQKEFDTRNIEEETIKNNAFRKVVFTGNTLQLVLMSLLPNEDIGMEVHDNVDQFFRIEKGEGLLEIEGQGSQPVKDGFSILITAGTKHNVKNIGSETLKLYTIYGPPNHPADRLQNTKAEAVKAEEESKKVIGDKKTKDADYYAIVNKKNKVKGVKMLSKDTTVINGMVRTKDSVKTKDMPWYKEGEKQHQRKETTMSDDDIIRKSVETNGWRVTGSKGHRIGAEMFNFGVDKVLRALKYTGFVPREMMPKQFTSSYYNECLKLGEYIATKI